MRTLLSYIDDIRFRRYLPYQLPCGKARAYFYHIRKTGGQSILQGLLAACDPEKRDPAQLMRALGAALRHRMAFGGRVFVVGEKKLVPKGEYFFAQTHMAMHEIQIPPNTLTMTCLRDPAERVLSHYRSMQSVRRHGKEVLALLEKKEGHRLGSSLSEFLERVPQAWLQPQLHTFSASFDIDEALKNIAKLDLVIFNDQRSDGVAKFSGMIGLEINNIHAHRSKYAFAPDAREIELLRARIAPEIAFYREARNLLAR